MNIYIYLHTSMTYIYICEFVCTCPMVLDTNSTVTGPNHYHLLEVPTTGCRTLIVFSSDVPTKKIDTHIYMYIYTYIYKHIHMYIYKCAIRYFPCFQMFPFILSTHKSIQKPTEDASWLDAPSYGGILRAPRWDVTGHSLYSSYT